MMVSSARPKKSNLQKMIEKDLKPPVEGRRRQTSRDTSTNSSRAASPIQMQMTQSDPPPPTPEVSFSSNEDIEVLGEMVTIPKRAAQRNNLTDVRTQKLRPVPSTSKRPITGIVRRELPTKIESMTDIFQTLYIGNGETRANVPHVREEEMNELQDRVQELAIGHKGDKRIAQLSSQWKQFEVFIQELPTEAQELDLSWRAAWYLEGKRDQGSVLGGVYKTAKNLRQMMTEMEMSFEKAIMDAIVKSYDRKGGRKAEQQAVPATRAEVEQAMERATPGESVGLWLAWKTASRIGEIQELKNSDLVIRETSIIVNFPFHKGDPYYMGTTIVVDTQLDRDKRFVDMLKQRMIRGPTAPVTELHTQRAEALLKRVKPELTAHSIKRGALIVLLDAKVPLSIIQVIAKHKDLETLYIYLPKDRVSEALGIPEATMAL
eukprot:PhF_6_TR22574/c2_g3_i1/m.32152